MIRVITVSREFGSGGAELARLLGERLHWSVVDDDLVGEIATNAKVSVSSVRNCDESVDSWTRRLARSLWLGGFENVLSRAEDTPFDSDQMAEMWNQVILRAADAGNCVVVGRGGQCLLGKRTDAFHVQVYAPMSERVKRVRERMPQCKDPEAAAFARDECRSAYVRRHFHHDWTNRHLYHLTICSSIGLERAADTILCAAGLLRRFE